MNPWQVPGDVLPSLGRILERVHGRDVWPYRPLFQQSRDFAEHFPRRREPHHRARHTVPGGLFLRYGLGGSDELAAFLQDEERTLLCIATDQVEDHIDLLSQHLLELRLSIIDNLAGSDGLEVRLIVAACRGNDGGTGMRCQLHRIGAHSAGTTMDQDRLSLFQVPVGEDSLPRSLGGHRHRCRLLKGEVRWFPYDGRRLDSQIFRVGAARSVGTEYGITWRPPRNVTANLFNEP